MLLTVAIAVGGSYAVELFVSSSNPVVTLSEQQEEDAGGLAVFVSTPELSIESVALDYGSVAIGGPWNGDPSARVDLDDESMHAFVLLGGNATPRQGDHVLFVLWGNARLRPDSFQVLDVPTVLNRDLSNPSVMDELHVSVGLGCSAPPTQEGVDRLMFDVRMEDPHLQVLDFELAPSSGAGGYRYFAFRGQRVSNNVVEESGNSAIALPGVFRQFPFPLSVSDSAAPWGENCASPSTFSQESRDVLLRRDYFPDADSRTVYDINAGSLSPSEDFVSVDPEPIRPRMLSWSTENSYDAYSIAPVVVMTDRSVRQASDVGLFISGAVFGALGGAIFEWFKLLPAASKELALAASLSLVALLFSVAVILRWNVGFARRLLHR